MKSRTIELSFPQISWPILIGGGIVLSLLLYWFFAMRPYLHVEGAKVSAPFLEIRADRMGRLALAPYEDGSFVKQGDVLFSLNTEEEKEAQRQLQASVDSLRETLAYHVACVEQATQDYVLARSDVEMGLASKEQCDQPLAVLQELQTGVNDCRQQLAAAQKNLDQINQQAMQKTVLAPFNGVVVKKHKSEGEVVQSGDIVYSFCDPHRVWVDATIPEKQIAKVAINQKATVHLLSDSTKKWEGTVSWISPVALASGIGVPVRIQLEKHEGSELKPNLSADVKIKIH